MTDNEKKLILAELQTLKERVAVLESLLPTKEQPLSCLVRIPKQLESPNSQCVRVVVEEVTAAYGVTFDILRSRCRTDAVSVPRQITFYLCKEIGRVSWSELGRIFNRDHGTIMHGYRMIAETKDVDSRLSTYLATARARCEQRLKACDGSAGRLETPSDT